MAYQNETFKENSYWADVYYYMEANECDKATAMAEIEKDYKVEVSDEELIKFTYKRKGPQARPTRYGVKNPRIDYEPVKRIEVYITDDDDEEDEEYICDDCGEGDCECED